MNQIPVTRQQFRMMCGKAILQLFWEDLNYAITLMIISYHYISAVTVSSSNRHPVCAGSLLSKHVLLGYLDS